MDDTLIPAVGSFDAAFGGVPEPVTVVSWDNPTRTRLNTNHLFNPADTGTVNFPATDTNLRTIQNRIVEPWGPISFP